VSFQSLHRLIFYVSQLSSVYSHKTLNRPIETTTGEFLHKVALTMSLQLWPNVSAVAAIGKHIASLRFKENVAKHITGGLIDEKGSVTKRLWSYIKSQRKDHCGVAPLKVDRDV